MSKLINYIVKDNSETYNKLIDIFVGYHKETSGGFTSKIFEVKIREILGFEKNSRMMFYPVVYFCNQELLVGFKEEWNLDITNEDLVLYDSKTF